MLRDQQFWIACPVILPLFAGFITFCHRRWAFFVCLTTALLNCLSVTFLLAQLLQSGRVRYALGGWLPPLGITLQIDGPTVLLLMMTAITAIGITLYAYGYFSFRIADHLKSERHARQQRYFWPLWMILFGGLNGLFLAGDVFNVYVTLEIVGIAAVALSALSGKPASQLAAFRYLLVNLLGSLSYLLGVAILYKRYAVLDFCLLHSAAIATEGTYAALTLITIGLLLKTALFPMHFWLPPAHANALAPVSAVLSSLVVKASFYLLFRFWFDLLHPVASNSALECIGLLGCGAVLWGAAQAIRQQRLKLLIAYSTVSQLGYLFIAFPLVRLDSTGQVWSSVLFMAMGHAWAKSAMFMAAGAVFLHVGHDRINELAGIRTSLPVTVFAYAIAGVNLMGLPPTGGFIAKWLLLTSSFRSSTWWLGAVIMTGSLLASVYIFRVVSRFFVTRPGQTPIRRHPHSVMLEWPALTLALLSFSLGIFAPFATKILAAGAQLTSLAGVLP